MTNREQPGYTKVSASKLAPREQELLRAALRDDLCQALIKSVRDNPPQISLQDIEVILQPGQDTPDWGTAADCVTCLTCWTCSTT